MNDGKHVKIISVMNMKMPNRKQNRLGEFDYEQAGAYFVTLCTHNRARLFQMEFPVGNGLCAVPKTDTAGNSIIHKWLKETERKFPSIATDKYLIMPDHLHLIVTIKERHAGRAICRSDKF